MRGCNLSYQGEARYAIGGVALGERRSVFFLTKKIIITTYHCKAPLPGDGPSARSANSGAIGNRRAEIDKDDGMSAKPERALENGSEQTPQKKTHVTEKLTV